MNVTALKSSGIFVSIIGGVVAVIGGLSIARAASGDDTWGLAIGVLVAVVGGLLSALGGFVTDLKAKPDSSAREAAPKDDTTR